ncbi:hypothetical protein GQ54DRAFT_316630 [Martensiomyces pterosporus]|nr:hypothetical protein GQ54DRAFT_316630 [Martensiomyces pterosporus]
MTLAYTLLHILVFFPLFLLRTGNSVTAALFRYDASQSTLALMSTSDAVSHFFNSLPLLGLDLVIHVKPEQFESIFFAMLDEISPEYSVALRSWPPKKHHWARIKFTVQRIVKRYLMTLGVSYLSRIPLVGWLVVPVGTVAMMAKFVGYPVSGGIVLLSVIAPGSKQSTLFLFKSLLAMRDFSRDLLKPYFTYLGMKPKQQLAFYRAQESVMVGFITAFYFFVQLSWVGPAFYILAQAAIALFIVRQTPCPPMYTPGAKWETPEPAKDKKSQ